MEKRARAKYGPPKPERPPFGRVVRRLRLEKNITQEGLDKLAGLGSGRTGSYEGGQAIIPPLEVIRKYSRVFDLSVDALIELMEAEEHPPAPVLTDQERIAALEAQNVALVARANEQMEQLRLLGEAVELLARESSKRQSQPKPAVRAPEQPRLGVAQ